MAGKSASAIERYSKDRPVLKVEDVTSAGGNALPLPAGWETDFSDLQNLEYPLDQVPPRYVSNEDYYQYISPTGKTINLLTTLSDGEQARMTYTITHTLSLTVDTIPLGDREPVCCLAAASLCDQLAGLYSGDSDSTIQADSVNHQSKASEFAKRANALRKRYLNELGIDAKKNVAAGVVVSTRPTNSQGGQRLTHGRKHRG